MAIFPGAIATDANLYVAVNGLQTTLSAPALVTDVVLTLTSTTGFPVTGAVTLDATTTSAEVAFYTGISGNTLTGVTRGADGTTAYPHNAGAVVGATIVAAHHNLLKNEIEAIETALGAGYTRALANLLDVTITSPSTGQVLQWNGTAWVNATSAAGITQLTGPVTAGPGSGSVSTTITPTGVTPGSYTAANVTVNAAGQITSASNGSSGGINQLTGDVTAGPGSGSQVSTLATVNSSPGSFTNASVTVNGKGLVTSATSGTAPVNSGTIGDLPYYAASGSVLSDSLYLSYDGHSILTLLSAVGNLAELSINGQAYGAANLKLKTSTSDGFVLQSDNSTPAHFNIYDVNTNFLILTYIASSGTVAIGGTPSASAVLSLVSTTKGFLPPTMTTTQRNAISSPDDGLIVYDATLHQLWEYQNGAWAEVGGGGGSTPGGSNGELQYNSSGTFAGTSAITTNGTIITSYHGDTTAGNGLVSIVDYSDYAIQTLGQNMNGVVVDTTQTPNIPFYILAVVDGANLQVTSFATNQNQPPQSGDTITQSGTSVTTTVASGGATDNGDGTWNLNVTTTSGFSATLNGGVTNQFYQPLSGGNYRISISATAYTGDSGTLQLWIAWADDTWEFSGAINQVTSGSITIPSASGLGGFMYSNSWMVEMIPANRNPYVPGVAAWYATTGGTGAANISFSVTIERLA